MSSSISRTLLAVTTGFATAITLGSATAVPAAASAKRAPLITPQTVAEFRSLPFEDEYTLYHFPQSLLRADGSFGYFTARYAAPHDDVPMELVTFGGPVPAGALRKQNIDGALGGTLPFPGVTASGVDGYDWVFDDAEWRLPKPGEQADPFSGWVQSEPSLIAIDDRGKVVRRTSLDFGPRTFTEALVPTGDGLRAVTQTNNEGYDVRRSTGKLVAHLTDLWNLNAVVGRSDGSVLLSGYFDGKRRPWSSTVIRVSRRGKVAPVRAAGHKLVKGNPLTAVRGGVLLASDTYDSPRISVLTDRGRVVPRRLNQLKLPWSSDCRERGQGFSLRWATAGSSGRPIIAVECWIEGDRTNDALDTLTVGLDDKLRARWTVRGESQPLVGPDGRQYVVDGSFLRAWREPGAGKPRRGHVVSVRRSGPGAVAKIRCNAPAGSVCSGTARLTRGGKRAVEVPYALRGRPGTSAAIIRRHFEALPAGSGRLRVTLVR